MSILGLVLLSLFTIDQEHDLQFGINKKIFSANYYNKGTHFLGFLLYFLWIGLSILWSADISSWFHDFIGKASILGFAFVWMTAPQLSNKEIRLIHFGFCGTIMAACLLVLTVYIPQFDHITLLIGSGRPIPMPIDHVRFSMMVAYASVSSVVFLLFYWKELSRRSRLLHLIFGLTFFIFTHILAVRSGIFLLYAGTCTLLVFYIAMNKQLALGLIGLAVVILLPLIAYNTVPSFKNKVLYTKYDLQRSFGNDGANYSDGDRIRSIKNGIELWKQYPMFGLGGGDYKSKMVEFYELNKQSGRSLLPHNQWIRSGMAYGIIGVLLLISGFIYILLYKQGYRNILLISITQLFFLSLLVESNMERYYALVFFFFFLGLNAQIQKYRFM